MYEIWVIDVWEALRLVEVLVQIYVWGAGAEECEEGQNKWGKTEQMMIIDIVPRCRSPHYVSMCLQVIYQFTSECENAIMYR